MVDFSVDEDLFPGEMLVWVRTSAESDDRSDPITLVLFDRRCTYEQITAKLGGCRTKDAALENDQAWTRRDVSLPPGEYTLALFNFDLDESHTVAYEILIHPIVGVSVRCRDDERPSIRV